MIVATEERTFETSQVAVSYALGSINNVIFNGGRTVANQKPVLVGSVDREPIGVYFKMTFDELCRRFCIHWLR